MKILIVEDEFVSRKKTEKILFDLGSCDFATNGIEAINAFSAALDEDKPYDLITMDIDMPDMGGHEASKKIRDIENKKRAIRDKSKKMLNYVKILMISIHSDSKNIVSSFTKDDCDAYIIKPITKKKVVEQLRKLGFCNPP